MSDDSKFDAFLRKNVPATPAKPASEWSAIQARISSREESWIQILSNSVRAFDFWAPSLAMSALALVGVTLFLRMEEAPSTAEAVGRISEIYTTDLISSTAYDSKILN